MLSNAPGDAIARLKPDGKSFGAFAGVASEAAEHDVLFRDDASIIDDVLPRRTVATRDRHWEERGTAIDARTIPLDHLKLQPGRDAPTVHRKGGA